MLWETAPPSATTAPVESLPCRIRSITRRVMPMTAWVGSTRSSTPTQAWRPWPTTPRATDAANNVVSVTDPVGNKTSMSYDSLNRLTQQTDPLNHSATFAYDAASRETSTTDRNGNVRNFSFDNANRKTGETWIVSGSTANLLTFTYDNGGNQLTAANYGGTYTMTYDALNRTATQTEPFGQALTFTYDAVNNRTCLQDSQSGVTTSIYDAVHRLTSRQFGGSGQTPL